MSTKVNLRPWLKSRLPAKVEEHGPEWAVPCPDCDVGRGKNFRLWFNVEKNVGTCYKCHRVFHAASLVQALEGVSLQEAIRLVKENTVGGVLSLASLRTHVEEAFSEKTSEKLSPLPKMDLPDEFISASVTPPEKWPPYLMKRIGSAKTILGHWIGWCDRGYYRNRLIVPIFLNGVVVAFIARDMTGQASKKVLYPKGCKTSRMLFNYDRARYFETVILVEGVLDALRVGPRALAILGTSLSREQSNMLAESNAREVVLMFDGDKAGRAATAKIAQSLRGSFKVRPVALPEGVDPDDLPRSTLRRMALGGSRGGFSDHIRGLLAGL